MIKSIKHFSILLLILPQFVFSNNEWGKTGHRTVGKIAEKHLTNKTKRHLKKLLDDKFEDTEWLSVDKPVNKFFRINGKDGKQKLKVPQNNFPSFIVKEAKTFMK